MIPLYCALGFTYLGFRYGMYAHEGWKLLAYNESLTTMLLWGLLHSIVAFAVVTLTIYVVIRNPKNYAVKLFSLIFTEVLGIGSLSGIFIIKGLIFDPWYIGSLTIFSGIVFLASVFYVNFQEGEHQRNEVRNIEKKFSAERLKLQHKKYLQYINSMCWVIVFILLGYTLQILLSPQPVFDDPTYPILMRLRLMVVNIVGLIYITFGLSLGILWQMVRRINQIEEMLDFCK